MNNIDYLRVVDLRISSLNIHNRDSSEYERMVNVVRPDILSRLTEDEEVLYNVKKVLTSEEKERIRIEDLIAMEQNRDSQSI